MTRSFAEWATDSRVKTLWSVCVAASVALFLPFTSWLPGALIVLLAVAPAPLDANRAALAAAAVILARLLLLGSGGLPAVLVTAALLLPALVLGRLLARGASLNLCFQLAALAVLGMLGVVYGVIADPPGFWRPLLESVAADLTRFATAMSNAGSGRALDTREIVAASAQMWGVVGWLLLLNTMVCLFVGLAFARRKGVVPAASAFRDLSAGRTLATVSVVCLVLAVSFAWPLPADALWVFLGVFVLQGLAVLHAAREGLGLSGAWLGVTYVLLLLPPTTLFVQIALSALGFLDNWVALRPRLKAPRGGADS